MIRIRTGAVVPLVALAIALVVAACGGGSGATQVPGGTQAPGGATQPPAATQGAVPTVDLPAITIAPVASTGSGGGKASEACGLITTDEVASALGTAALEATSGSLAGQSFCDYRTTDGQAVMTSYMQPVGAAQIWGIWKSSLTTEPVSGFGDEAMFEPSTKLLFVLKGDAFFNVFIADVDMSPADALEQEKKLAQIMVGRL